MSTPDARLLCCVPNMAHATVIERMLAGDLSSDPVGLLDSGHIRLMAPASTFKLLLDAGWLPNLRDAYVVTHPATAFTRHLLSAATELGIPPNTAVRNLHEYQLIIDAIKAPRSPQSAPAVPFSVVVPVNRPAQFALNVQRSPGLLEVGAEIIAIPDAASAADALARGRAQASNHWIVYCHQDVYFPKGSGRAIGAELARIPDSEASETLLGFAGLDGSEGGGGRYAGLVIDRRARFDHAASDRALSLDELAIVVARDSIHEIDPALGWHTWATDLCLEALHGRGSTPARILRIPLFHNSYGDHSLPADFMPSVEVLNGKWHRLASIPTLNGSFGRANPGKPGDPAKS